MRRLISLVLLFVVGAGVALSLWLAPFGADSASRAGGITADEVNFGTYKARAVFSES